MDPLVIWSNAHLTDSARARLIDGTRGQRLVMPAAGLVAPSGSGAVDEALAEADVAFGQPDPAQLLTTPRSALQIHLSSCWKYTPYDRALASAARSPAARARASRRAIRSSMTKALRRARARVPCWRTRAGCPRPSRTGWGRGPGLSTRSGRARACSRLRRSCSSASGRSRAGWSSSWRRCAHASRACAGASRATSPCRRSPGVSAEAARALGEADVVVDLLPGGAGTHRAFDAARLASLKPGAVFINIGRGSTVDQDALAAALAGGRLGAAYLDVTEPEPLPPDHALWSTPRCFITPHTAGGDAARGANASSPTSSTTWVGSPPAVRCWMR